jgi:hypothetical protein
LLYKEKLRQEKREINLGVEVKAKREEKKGKRRKNERATKATSCVRYIHAPHH